MFTENSEKTFLTVAAICSFAGAITTTLLIFLPSTPAVDFEAMVQLQSNSLYLAKLWILFIHPQVNIVAALGIAYCLFRKNPISITIGTLFLFVWAYTEMSQQALLIDALNQLWRPAYLNASDDEMKTMYTTLITAATGISDSKYFLVLYSFGIGSLLYGWVLLDENIFGKCIGISLFFIGILSLSSFTRFYLGATFMDNIVDWLYQWIYSYLQPMVRIAIGFWILHEIKRNKD